MGNKEITPERKKAQMWWQGAVIFFLLYILSLPWRPFYAPGEYAFIAALLKAIPAYPVNPLMCRLPAAIFTLATALLLDRAGKLCSLKRPGGAAAFYLTLPPVFWMGTLATGLPAVVLGTALVLYGILFLLLTPESPRRFWGAVFIVPGAALAAFAIVRDLVSLHAIWQAILVPAVFAIAIGFEKLEARHKDKLKMLLNRFSYFCTGLLLTLAALVLLPSLLRYFKVDYPHNLAFYAPGEYIFRPVLVLLVPVLWLHLLRKNSKMTAKLSCLSVAIVFLLFMLPQVVPHTILREKAPVYTVKKFHKELTGSGITYFADRESAVILQVETGIKAQIIGSGEGEIPPEKLADEVKKHLRKGEVCISYCDRKNSKLCPALPGRISFGSEKFSFYRYVGGVK